MAKVLICREIVVFKSLESSLLKILGTDRAQLVLGSHGNPVAMATIATVTVFLLSFAVAAILSLHSPQCHL